MTWFLAIATALVLAAIQFWVVAHHPEPAPDEPDAELKTRYAELVNPRALGLAVPLVALGLWPLLVTPLARWPVWVVWASVVAVLVWVDARTTWLPARAQLFAELAMLVAVVAVLLASPGGRASLLLGALGGALVTAGLFAVFWWFSGALGFGDVRLAGLVGALCGLGGLDAWYAGVLAATVAGAAWGLATSWWRRRHPSPLGRVFAYGPALWLGPYLGLAWLQLA